jgi:hypothetical protein
MTMSTPKISGASKFGLAWLAVNAAGWGAGFGLQMILSHSLSVASLSVLFGLLVASGVIGAAQWLALRWLMPRLRPGSQGIAWVILTMFGFTAGSLIGSMFTMLGGDAQNSPVLALAVSFISYAVLGLMTGLLQWMALQYSARGAGWWIGANGLGYGLGAILLSVIRVEAGNSPIAFALAGLVVGATTSVAISRLRRRTGL